MRSMKTIGIIALIGTATTLALVVPAASATAARRSAQPAMTLARQVDYGQIAANAVAGNVTSAIAAEHLAGFAGEEVNPSLTHPGLTIYWHGRVPVMLRRAAAGYATAKVTGVAAGVAVSFKSAPFTRANLLSLQQAINNVAGFWHLGIGAMGFYPEATAFWIEVSARADITKLRKLAVIGHSRIPVHFFVGQQASLTEVSRAVPHVPVAGRFKDAPPFSGGAFIASKFANQVYQCSSGFGMHFRNRRGAPFFMLTAGHCIEHNKLGTQLFWIWGNHKNVGNTFGFIGDDDVSSLDTRGGVRGAGGAHTIYVGNTSLKNSRGQSKANVKGSARIVTGDLVSTSGAFSGERTRIKVVSTDWEWMAKTVDGLGYRVFGARLNKTNHSNAAGKGDSGGPVFVNVKGGVKAVGIVSATTTTRHSALCTGIIEVGGHPRKCFWDIEIPFMTGTATSIEANMNLTENRG